MPFLDLIRRRPPAPPLDGPISYERLLNLSTRDVMRRGWPRDLQRVRQVLDPHLHDWPPNGAARYGFWPVVARAGGVPVGVAWTVHSITEPDRDGAYIEEVAVLQSHQGRGIGPELLRQTAAWMVELGRHRLSIRPVSSAGWIVRAGFRLVADGDWYEADGRQIASGRLRGDLPG